MKEEGSGIFSFFKLVVYNSNYIGLISGLQQVVYNLQVVVEFYVVEVQLFCESVKDKYFREEERKGYVIFIRTCLVYLVVDYLYIRVK